MESAKAMTDRLILALAQVNPTVGDVAGNRDKLLAARAEAKAFGADLVVPGELVLSGYPPEDLVLKPAFLDALADAVDAIARATTDGGPAVLVTTPWRVDGKTYNAALLVDGGKVVATRLKYDLPNYGVFDEKRVFAAGPMPGPIAFRGVRLGVMICEDMWTADVTETLEESGAELLIVPNGSPYEHEKLHERLNLAVARVVESGLPLVYVNQIGGQDEIVFDGGSFVVGSDRHLKAQLPAWRECVRPVTFRRDGEGWAAEGEIAKVADGHESIYQAMVVGLRDYVEKSRFPGVILGLSGGIDSALSAAVAVDALGPDRVRAVMMPSPYTSQDSLDDAAECARLLGIRLDTVSIEPAMEAFDAMLKPLFDGRAADITEENIQSGRAASR